MKGQYILIFGKHVPESQPKSDSVYSDQKEFLRRNTYLLHYILYYVLYGSLRCPYCFPNRICDRSLKCFPKYLYLVE